MNGMKIGTIRKSTAEDAPDIYALICEMENKELPQHEFEQIYARQLQDEKYICLVYVTDARIVGCINLRMEWQLHHAEKICEIMELAVGKDYRSKGIGKSLFDAACEKAQHEGCSQIEVCCNRLRLRTHKFYEARGMHNFHYKFSLNFSLKGDYANELGR